LQLDHALLSPHHRAFALLSLPGFYNVEAIGFFEKSHFFGEKSIKNLTEVGWVWEERNRGTQV
jgi:hypothetical protein